MRTKITLLAILQPHTNIKHLLQKITLASLIALSSLVTITPAMASWYNPFSWFNSPPNASSLSDKEIKQKAIEFALKAKEDRRIRVGDSYKSTYALVRNPNTSSYVYTVSGWKSTEFSDVRKHLPLLPQLDPRTTNKWAKNLGYINPDNKEKGFASDEFSDMKKPWAWYVWGSRYIGTYNASHSEIQMLYNFHNDFISGKKYAIGFAQKSRSSNTMCDSCQPFLKFYTRKFHLRIAIASYKHIYFFDNGATFIAKIN